MLYNDKSLTPKPTRYDKLDELDSYNIHRLKLFEKQYPNIFENKYEDVNHQEAINYLNYHYQENNRSRFISLLKNIHYYIMPIDYVTFSPDFNWEMMVKYDGVMTNVTNTDRRKWKIKEVLK